jgi:hypothetical protein
MRPISLQRTESIINYRHKVKDVPQLWGHAYPVFSRAESCEEASPEVPHTAGQWHKGNKRLEPPATNIILKYLWYVMSEFNFHTVAKLKCFLPFKVRQLNVIKFVLHYKCSQTDFRKAQFEDRFMEYENNISNIKQNVKIGKDSYLKYQSK